MLPAAPNRYPGVHALMNPAYLPMVLRRVLCAGSLRMITCGHVAGLCRHLQLFLGQVAMCLFSGQMKGAGNHDEYRVISKC